MQERQQSIRKDFVEQRWTRSDNVTFSSWNLELSLTEQVGSLLYGDYGERFVSKIFSQIHPRITRFSYLQIFSQIFRIRKCICAFHVFIQIHKYIYFHVFFCFVFIMTYQSFHPSIFIISKYYILLMRC